MTKSDLLLPFFILLISACALSDNSEVVTETQESHAPTPEAQIAQVPPAAELPHPDQNKVLPKPRIPSSDEIRRLQMRLREVGFDPGPADGIAGARTKAALSRLHNGCVKVKPVIDNSENFASMTADNKPSRQEIRTIQSQLRNAGFDPGPIDGIYGQKTNLLVSQLRNLCAIPEEYVGLMDNRPGSRMEVSSSQSPTAAPETSAKVSPAINSTRNDDMIKPATVPLSVRSHEEIRILQLRLRDAGFDPGPFDGVMGPKTQAALQQYQAAQRNNKSKVSLTSGLSGHYWLEGDPN